MTPEEHNAAERTVDRMFCGALLVIGAACIAALVVSGTWRVLAFWVAWVAR